MALRNNLVMTLQINPCSQPTMMILERMVVREQFFPLFYAFSVPAV